MSEQESRSLESKQRTSCRSLTLSGGRKSCSRIALGHVAALACALAAASVGCSLTRAPAECESASECAEAFGPGTICSSTGLCEPATTEATCQNQLPVDLLTNPSKYKNWVLLGSLLRASGKEGARNDAAELVVDNVNLYLQRNAEDYPELAELRFGLIQCDHDGDTEEVARLARHLTDQLQAKLILGPASSSRAEAAFRAINLSADGSKETRRALFVSPSATSVALTGLEETQPGMFWRTAPTDDGQGRMMGAYAKAQNMPVAVFYEDTTYGRGLYEELVRSVPALCDDCGVPFDAQSPSISALSRAIASNEGQASIAAADTVIFVGSQENHIRYIVNEIEDEFSGKVVFFSDAAANAETLKAVPKDALGRVLGTRASPPQESETLRIFSSEYEDAHEESPLLHSFTANAYDATWLLLLGSIWAQLTHGKVTPALAAEGLQQLSDDSHKHLDASSCPVDTRSGDCPPLSLDTFDLTAIIESFRRGRAVDIVGASGDLDYCAENEELERHLAAFEMWTLEETEADAPQPYRLVTIANAPVVEGSASPCPIE